MANTWGVVVAVVLCAAAAHGDVSHPGNGHTQSRQASGVTPAVHRHLQATAFVRLDNDAIEWYGRRTVVADSGAVELDYPGTGFMVQVNGTTTVSVELQGLGRHYWQVSVNNELASRVISPAARTSLEIAAGLDAHSAHTIHFVKLSEAATGFGSGRAGNWVTMHTLVLDGGGSVVPFDARPFASRRVEFIGDSLTVGFGALVGTTPPPGDAEYTCEDADAQFRAVSHREAFSGRLCRQLDADCRYLAWGGMGLTRNSDGGTDLRIGDVLNRSVATRSDGSHNFTSWVPHAVVLTLGDADVAGGADGAVFQAELEALASRIRTVYAAAAGADAVKIVFACGPMASATTACPLAQAAAAAVQGDVLFLHLQAGGALGGCDGHPTANNSRAIVADVLPAVRALTGWSPSPTPGPTPSFSPSPSRTASPTKSPSLTPSISTTATASPSYVAPWTLCECRCGSPVSCCEPGKETLTCSDGGFGIIVVAAAGVVGTALLAAAVVVWNMRRQRKPPVGRDADVHANPLTRQLQRRVKESNRRSKRRRRHSRETAGSAFNGGPVAGAPGHAVAPDDGDGQDDPLVAS